MATAGPPSVAILVEAGFGSAAAGALTGSDAADSDITGATSFAGDKTCGDRICKDKLCSVDATFVSSAGGAASAVSVMASVGAAAASVCRGLSAAGSGLATAGVVVSGCSGFNAAICSGSAGGEAIAAGPADSAILSAGMSSDDRGSGSSRSIASTGLVASLAASLGTSVCCAKLVSGPARQAGVLANCSWAARSSAAAPSPKTSIDIDNTIAANRKRKPGSMERRIPPSRGYCEGP